MADIPKLADTFDALKVTVAVDPRRINEAKSCYDRAGLDPRLGFDDRNGGIVIRVSVPVDPNQCPIGSVPAAFSRLTDTFGGEIRSASEMQLICPVRHLIDCNKAPFVPEGFVGVESHTRFGLLEWNPAQVEFYISLECRRRYLAAVTGFFLRDELRSKVVLNANVLDYLLANQGLIPEDWEADTFFWGTIYERMDGDQRAPCVRCMYKRNDGWKPGFRQLNSDFNAHHLAICLKA